MRHVYECWGCGEEFRFSPDWGVDMDAQPCPNRCGNLLVRVDEII